MNLCNQLGCKGLGKTRKRPRVQSIMKGCIELVFLIQCCVVSPKELSRGYSLVFSKPFRSNALHIFFAFISRIQVLGFACVLFVMSAAVLRAQTVYSSVQEVAYFGWLDQYSLSGPAYGNIGPEACVPTSSTNAMTFLQGLAPSYFGVSLTGTTYADWIATDVFLASASYMDTSAADGTYYNHLPYSLNKYIREDKGFTDVSFSGIFPSSWWDAAPYNKPSYMADGMPTWSFLNTSLAANQATLFSIEYSGGGGHELLLSGFAWTDANDDGIVQKSENATIYFVDPLDPSASYPGGEPGGGAKFTQGHIWNRDGVLGAELMLDYNQYSQGLPYASNYSMVQDATIDGVFAIAVPEAGSAWFLFFGGVCYWGVVVFGKAGRRRAG